MVFGFSGIEVIADGRESWFSGAVAHEAYQSMLRREWGGKMIQ